MLLRKSVVVLVFFIHFISAVDNEEESSAIAEDNKDNQNWHALDYFSPQSETSGWIPQPKGELPRRRIRKRKRRPPMISLTNPEDTLEELNRKSSMEPWNMSEGTQPDLFRRKSSPAFDEPIPPELKKEKIRDPFTALQEEEDKKRRKQEEVFHITPSQPDLKTIIKQSEGGSLSEILQRKNITLSELLMGNQDAISALTEKSVEVSREDDESTKIPIITTQKAINRNYEQSSESNEEPIVDAQRKRLSGLHGHKNNRIYQDVNKMEVVTEETTDRRIFIPFDDNDDEVTTTNVPMFSTILEKHYGGTKTLKPKLKAGGLPLTSAKLNKAVSKYSPKNRTTLPPKAIKIDVNELFGLSVKKSTEKGPMRMSINLDVDEATTPPTTTPYPTGEKLKHVTAKEEIMEILKNPVDRAKLSRILEIRNMTVDELVQQRERGSSQVHLADIFHNKTREPEPKDEPFVGYIHPDFFQNFPTFNRQQKSRNLPSVVKKDLKITPDEQIILTTTQSPINGPKLHYTITSFPTYKIESKLLNPDETSNSNSPYLLSWPQLYPNNFHKNPLDAVLPTTEMPTISTTTLPDIIKDNLVPIGNMDGIVNRVHDDIDDEEFITLPSGVKSAILASFAIVALSLLVFLTILVIFKWNQKHRRRLGYSESFSGSRIRSPILEPEQKRTLKNFMTETLGRKKSYYKTHLQSMSDSIWDTDKKPYM